MPDPLFGQEKEAIEFNLDQADQRYVESLASAENIKQVRLAIQPLLNIYSRAVDSASQEQIPTYISRFTKALQNLRNLPEGLRQKIDGQDSDSAVTILNRFATILLEKYGVVLESWKAPIEDLFRELGALDEKRQVKFIPEEGEKAKERVNRKMEMADYLEPLRVQVEAFEVVNKLRSSGKIVDISVWAANHEDISRLEIIVKTPKSEGPGYNYDLKLYWHQLGPDAGTLKWYENDVLQSRSLVEEEVATNIESILREINPE